MLKCYNKKGYNYKITARIRIVADFRAIMFQFIIKIKRTTILDYTNVSAINFYTFVEHSYSINKLP